MKKTYFITVEYQDGDVVRFAQGTILADMDKLNITEVTKQFLEGQQEPLQQPFEDTWYKITNFNLV